MLIGSMATDGTALWSGSIIEVLDDLGVKQHAARSTLGRMVDRGLLRRHRHGREMYYSLTPEAAHNIDRAEAFGRSPMARPWDGTWTVVAASIPENDRALRYQLASRLAREGFAQLQQGLWATPRDTDIDSLLSGLDGAPYVRAFTGQLILPATVGEFLHEIYDLDEITDRYERFIDRWDSTSPPGNPLGAYLLLLSEWAQLVRADPHLPAEHLPTGWKGIDAHQLFMEELNKLEPQAEYRAAQFRRLNIDSH